MAKQSSSKHPHKPSHPAKKHHPTPQPTPAPTPPSPTPPSTTGDTPVFAQPQPTPDPTSFKVPHPSDTGLYNKVNNKLLQPIPAPRGGAAEPVLTLADVYGSLGASKVAAIQQAGQIVFHSSGDTGSTRAPTTQNKVADKMVADFNESDPADAPSFFFHLGDVVYSFGEAMYYYDQFYEQYREYAAPIIAIPGNHDGLVYSGDAAPTLDAFLRNFCSATVTTTPEAGGLARTTMTAPGVYFTLDAPFVRILGVYSNVLEDPGVISSEGGTRANVTDVQLTFLKTALARCKSENYTGAVIVAVHHPPFTGGSIHFPSPNLSADIDSCAQAAGFWPHAVFSGHSHNYQRFTRTVNGMSIPYLVAGCGGHSPLAAMQKDSSGNPIRTPYPIDSELTLNSYDDTDYGYLRVVVNAQTMRIEYHPASDSSTTKTPDDVVTVNLVARTVS
ncbi:metallophosphoesterase family protein [Alloacidobacterium sp.]|uniref:metallophosphoesterase family protein n=1 Tax=Alloacidobacterium sp. TaxID=2951999 RepID=UPI002D6C02BE|nr:metallophosphoesterase [Alloacidobacterium sp.]HYK37128.1 metallophosphoesterase [Alloacidobacterium sp.]